MTGLDLIAETGGAPYNLAVPIRTFRQRLGDRLLVERAQVKHWSRSEAARQTGLSDGTIRAMEQGRNAGLAHFDRYADRLGLSLEEVCRDVIQRGADHAIDELSSDELQVLNTLRGLKEQPEARTHFMKMVHLFRQQHVPSPAPTTSDESALASTRDAPESTVDSRARMRKSRSMKH